MVLSLTHLAIVKSGTAVGVTTTAMTFPMIFVEYPSEHEMLDEFEWELPKCECGETPRVIIREVDKTKYEPCGHEVPKERSVQRDS